MSLLDDVSIVVTPNGYKAGELYAVIPVPTEGAEEITNGDFATDTDWVKETGWTISGDTANYDGVVAIGSISQNVTFTVGKRYKYTFTISNSTQGGVRVFIGNTVGIIHSSDGTYTGSIVYSSGAFIILQARDSFIGSIDNVSVKEYTSADMDVTRATAATRVDENGLVNYAEVIGGEEIVDGDFPSGTTAWSFGGGWSLGVDSAEATSGSSGKLSQTNTLNGKYAQVTLTVSNVGGAGLILIDYGSTGSAYITSDGTYTLYGTYDQDTFEIYKSATFSGTVTNISVKEVTRDNVPRIDYTGGGCPHILAEPQRRNLVTYSEVISNQTLLIGGAGTYTITDNYTNSPEGVQNASRVQMSIVDTNDGANYSLIALNSSMTNGVTREISFYAKSLTGLNQEVLVYWSTAKQIVTLTNDWQRFEISGTSDNSGAVLIGARGVTTQYYSGGDANLDFAIWGLQVEDDGSGGGSSYATSYIPTSGSTVTRNQDIFTRDGIGSLINSTEGVLFAEIAALSNTSTDRTMVSLSDGTTSNRVYIRYGNASNQIEGRSTVATANSGLTNYVVTNETNFHKVAYKWKLNDFALWIDGVEVSTSTGAVNSANTLNKLSFDSGAGTQIAEGKVKQLQVYDTALTDEQLLQLTGESGTDFYESYAEMASALTYTIQ
jgi:hypothetical protein